MNIQNLQGKRVVLYSRVSTIEQEKTGFSLDNQESEMIKFCKLNNAEIVKTYRESHSAKSYDRPFFNDLFRFVSNTKNNIDFILVYKWDRLSREVSNTDIILDSLKKIGIIVNAISEWKNLEDANDWFIHKILMANAEFENKRKSERVKDGNHRAKIEGRYISKPPLGYIPSKDEYGKTLIKPDPDCAEMVTDMLVDYSTGQFSQNELLKKYQLLGLEITKSNLSRILKNKLYMGLMDIKAYKDNPQQTVVCLHEPLISEAIFKQNQYYLSKKNRLKEKPKSDDTNLPFRGGFLKCPNCNRNMTGYRKEKKNGKEYYYYNCGRRYGCGKISFNVNTPHQLFEIELNKISPNKSVTRLFKSVLLDKYNAMNTSRTNEINTLKRNKEKAEIKANKLLDKLLDDKISDTIFNKANDQITQEIKDIEIRLLEIPSNEEDLSEYIKFSLDFIHQIGSIYSKADIKVKKMLLNSILSESLVFDGKKYRTLKFKEVITLLSRDSKGFKKNETKKGDNLSIISRKVLEMGLEPIRPNGHKILSLACLPIPPLEQQYCC